MNQTLSAVVDKTSNDVVLVVVIIAVVMVVIGIPWLRTVEKARKDRLDQYIEREGRLITVIEKNTEAFSRLAVMIENTEKNCGTCKTEQSVKMQVVHDSQIVIQSLIERVTAVLIERGSIDAQF